MKKLEIIIRPESLETVKEILSGHGCKGMSVLSIMGCGNQNAAMLDLKSRINLLPKIQVSVVIEDEVLDGILHDIQERVATGHVGDGKVLIFDLYDVMRIRTGQRGVKAI
ncbi:MAG: P-II family nitrogen regulator [Clostridiaceae bacterium]